MTPICHSEEVLEAKSTNRPIVALESTLISHGLPYPDNLKIAHDLEDLVRAEGAVPATIALADGLLHIGLSGDLLARLAEPKAHVEKVSRRDIGRVLSSKALGATTVSATMIAAHAANIDLFATGGIGGVHRGAEFSFDVSADLTELGRTPIAVVCAGAKSILDLPKTVEVLETQGVPTLGYKTDRFPAFFTPDSGLPVSGRLETPEAIASLIHNHKSMALQSGLLIANPIETDQGLDPHDQRTWLQAAEAKAKAQNIYGKELTPFLLSELRSLSKGLTLRANEFLIKSNAILAAKIAVALATFKEDF